MLFFAAVFCLPALPALAMLDLASVYCEALGYDSFTAMTKKGEVAVCILPDDRLVNAWDFYTGKVALEWSYCAQKGYEAKRVDDGKTCNGCTVCVLPDGKQVPVDRLMDLRVRESVCGDGKCGTGENYANCPKDCTSGLRDDYCDKVSDGRCDSDCVERGGPDPDCPGLFVDIKPRTCPNRLALDEKKELSVAILGRIGFRVKQIDPRSVRLYRKGIKESVRPVSWKFGDVATPNPATSDCKCWSVPGDRQPDLILQFDTSQVIKVLELKSLAGSHVPLIISAKRKSGAKLAGSDCVQIFK